MQETPHHTRVLLGCRDLIKKLLEIDRTLRIGCMKNGPLDVMQHKWFEKIDWEDVAEQKLKVSTSAEHLHASFELLDKK